LLQFSKPGLASRFAAGVVTAAAAEGGLVLPAESTAVTV
jgi:hypothetical protein